MKTPEIQNQLTEPAMIHLILAEQKNLAILFSVLSSTSTDLVDEKETRTSRKNGSWLIKPIASAIIEGKVVARPGGIS